MAESSSGECCFHVTILKSLTILGEAVQLKFQVYQHIRVGRRPEQLMNSLIFYFDCGKIYKSSEIIDLKVTRINDIVEKIIPFELRCLPPFFG